MKIKIEKLKVNKHHKELYTTNDIDDLVLSIPVHGLLEKIVVNNSYEIISGYRRYLALNKLGHKTVDVVIKQIAPVDEKATIISYNKQRIKTASELLNEIDFYYDIIGKKKRGRKPKGSEKPSEKQNTRKKVAKMVGISEGTLNNLQYIRKNDKKRLKEIDKIDGSINKVYTAVKNNATRNKIINFNKNRPSVISNKYYTIYNKCSSNLSDIEPKSVTAVITSPPFWGLRKYSQDPNELGAEETPELYIKNVANHLHQCYDVLKDDGIMFLNLGDTYVNKSLQMIPARVATELMKKGWYIRNQIIWKKTNHKPESVRDRLTNSYEPIYFLTKSAGYEYNPIRLPAKTNSNRITSIHAKDKHYGDSSYTSTSIPSGTKNIDDYLTDDVMEIVTASQHEFKKFELEDHPAAFSEKLVDPLLLLSTCANDVVLDPFSGSGTVGAVALREGRKYIGYDTNSNFNISVERRLDAAIVEYNKRNQLKIAA